MSVEVDYRTVRISTGRTFHCQSPQQAHMLAAIIEEAVAAAAGTGVPKRWGVLVRRGSCWVGAHWSPYNRRWCINLLPCVTIWFTLKGGKAP